MQLLVTLTAGNAIFFGGGGGGGGGWEDLLCFG